MRVEGDYIVFTDLRCNDCGKVYELWTRHPGEARNELCGSCSIKGCREAKPGEGWHP